MSRVAKIALVGLVAASCGGGPPVWAPTPVLAREESAACVRARALRARAPKLVEEGRVDRAARVLQRAEDLCSAEGPATWGERVTALAMLGRSAESLQLAARIERSDRASEADRAAAAAARSMAEEHARAIAKTASRREDPELFDPAEKRRAAAAELFRRGGEARRSGDHAAAKRLFLESWATSHPSPRALIEAGLAAAALGERADAQRLWDRAAYDDTASAVRPEVPAGAPRLLGGATMTWSPSGARLALAGDEEILVTSADLSPLAHLRTGEAVTALAFAPGDARLIAGLASGRVRVYDVELAAPRGELRGFRGTARALVVSSDGRLVVTAADEPAVRVWDADTGAPQRAIRSARPAIAMAIRGAELAWADDAGAITIADLATGDTRSAGRARGPVRALSFDGAALFVVTGSERLRFDLDRRAPPRSLARGRADAASFAGAAAAIETDKEILAVDLASGDTLASSPSRERGGVAAFAIAPGARAIAAVFRDRTLSLLPAKERRDRRDVAPASPLAAFAVAPTGKLFAASGEDGRVLLVSIGDATKLSSFTAPGARALAFSPDGRSLAVGADRRIDLHDVATAQVTLSITANGRVEGLAFSNDGLRLAAATDAPGASIFGAGSAVATHDLRLQQRPVRAARFSPDGQSIAIAAHEGVVLWRPEALRSSRLTAYGPEPRDLAFTPDGAGLIVADRRGLLLFGKAIENAPAPSLTIAVPSQALAVAVAGNGIVATAEGDHGVGLRGPGGQPIARFRAPEAAVRALSILPQGIVAASFADGAVRLFRAPGPAAAAALRPTPGLPQSMLAALIEAPSGHIEVVGPDAIAARALLRCRIDASLYPFEVCAEQFEIAGLVPLILAGQDPAEADP